MTRRESDRVSAIEQSMAVDERLGDIMVRGVFVLAPIIGVEMIASIWENQWIKGISLATICIFGLWVLVFLAVFGFRSLKDMFFGD
jgi:hypothetical protein